MGKLTNTLKRMTGVEPETPADPAPVDLRAQYVEAVAAFIAVMRRFYKGVPYAEGEARHYRRELIAIRDRARREGHREGMDMVWVEPDMLGGTPRLDWYEAATNHVLHGGPEPGPRPLHDREPEYWIERYREHAARLLQGYRSGDISVGGAAANELARIPFLAARMLGNGYREAERRFGPAQPFQRDEATLAAWEREVAHRLEHGESSGEYRPPAPPPMFRRMSEVPGLADHSAIVLLAEQNGQPIGARVILGAAVSHALVENGRAVWCELERVPDDPRAPVEQAPGEDWIDLHFLRETKLHSRHVKFPGTISPVPPDEAKMLVLLGAAEIYAPPPPPPPPPPLEITIFGLP